MPEVVMPRLSDSMEEGTIVRWLKQDGEEVVQGEQLAEVETDKATVTFDADADGTLRILVGEGETVPIGRAIAQIGETASTETAPTETAPTVAAPAVEAATEAAPAAAAPPPAPAERAANGRPKASPLARRIARESGVELTQLSGSGPGGRIVKADVKAAVPPEPQPTRGNKGAVTIHQPSRVQTQIAQRMAESKATIPDFTLRADVDMEHAVAMRSQLHAEPVPTYNDMVVRACAIALREHPRANAAYRDGVFELYERINVGIAVASADSLIVPTVFDADRKSLLEIGRESRGLAERVRSGEITPAELSGGTFTVSNLGMYGVSSFHAIINPPQAAILAVGEVREVPVVRDGQIAPGRRMTIALTCDHRILYGAPAAELLARVRQLLEQPVNLLV
ncbi:MAG TPA: dihydrolipoamide acetyltransferase family protein [Solirubrobacteraceae bacterium]|nr:dihydrolipoamide acetyltransferase family protein [Solirubrobacteraceae bacterium]